MTASNRIHHGRDLLAPVHLDGEVARFSTDADEVNARDNHLALRHNQSVGLPAVDDAGNTIAKIATNDGVHDVGRQSDNVWDQRIGVDHAHDGYAPASFYPASTYSSTAESCSLVDVYPQSHRVEVDCTQDESRSAHARDNIQTNVGLDVVVALSCFIWMYALHIGGVL